MLRINLLFLLAGFMLLLSGGLMAPDVSAQCRSPNERCTPTPVPPPGAPDADGDGMPDSTDRCPNSGGPAFNAGCPFVDSDGDGTADENDQCPEQGGPESNNGCPILSPVGTAPPAVMPTPYPLVFPEEGCYVGNPGPWSVNRREYPSLNAPIKGQLQPGQVVFSASDFTDSNGLLWYGLVLFGSPESNAYVMDWVAASVTEASEGCEPQRINPADLNLDGSAPPYRVMGWQFSGNAANLTASNALVQVCEDGMRVMYEPGEKSGCDEDTSISFDGMQSLFYCGDALVSAEDLSDCPGADNMQVVNTPLLLPNAVQIQPAGNTDAPDSIPPDFMIPGLLMFNPPGSEGEQMTGALVAMDFGSLLPDENGNPQTMPLLLLQPLNRDMGESSESSSAGWMDTLPAPSVVSGYWLVNAGDETTAIIPLPADDLARYGFNPQPEPPALMFLFPEADTDSDEGLPDIGVVGFNPQPEPPALLADMSVLLQLVPVSYFTVTNPTTPNTIQSLQGTTYVNTESGNLVSCPANLPATLPESATVPVCLEASVIGSP